MKIAVFVLLIVLSFLSCNTQNQENQAVINNKMIKNDSTLTLLVDAKYAVSHGWGHVYQCTVKEVLEGELEMDTIGIHVYATTNLYQGLLKEMTTYPNLIIHFEKTDRPHGPPPGFRDKQEIWWEIVSVQQQ